MTITVKDLEKVINIIQDYALTGDREILKQEDNKKLLLLAKNVDYSAKTQAEYDNSEFKDLSHGIGRMIMFLLNYYGEKYLDKGILTIQDDDPKPFSSSHTNTYQLVLKDPETHDKFGEYNPTAEDAPYDFNSKFIKQLTYYPDDKVVDTTATAWDSFQKAYTRPVRTFDFKSAFWKHGHEHLVNYILQIDSNSTLHLLNRITKKEKVFTFVPTPEHKEFLVKYVNLIHVMRKFEEYAWSNFIIDDSDSDSED